MSVVAYPQVPGLSLSSTYSVTVNGTNVPVNSYAGYAFCWFAFSGSAAVVVTVSESVTTHTLSPKRNPVTTAVNADEISFTLTEPRKLMLRDVNSLTEDLFIIGDALEHDAPVLGGSGVYDVTASPYSADRTGSANAAPGINAAITAASNAGGGTVFVKAGLYKFTSTIIVKSNVNLYLEAGACLRIPSSGSLTLTDQKGVLVDSARNARVTGRGVIYGNGTSQTTFFHLFHTKSIDTFLLEGIMLLDGYTTALRLLGNGHTIRNVKVLALSGRLSDGIDQDSGNTTLIEDCLIASSDDNIAVSYTSNPWGIYGNTDGVTVTGCLFYHIGAGGSLLKIAPCHVPNGLSVSNVLYDGNDSAGVKDVLGIYGAGPVLVSGITIRNTRAEEVRRAICFLVVRDFSVGWGYSPACAQTPQGNIRAIKLDGLTIDNQPPNNSSIYGYSSSASVDGVNYNAVWQNGALVTNPTNARLYVGPYGLHISFTNTLAIPPATPTGLHGASVSDTAIALGWQAVTGNSQLAGYKLYRDGSLISTQIGTSYSDTGLDPGTAYSYSVASYDSSGNMSPQSATISVSTPTPSSGDIEPPTTPGNFKAVAVSSSQVDLSWTESIDDTGVTGYTVYRDGSQIVTTTALSYTDAGRRASTTYRYCVRARDAAVNLSDATQTVYVTTFKKTPKGRSR